MRILIKEEQLILISERIFQRRGKNDNSRRQKLNINILVDVNLERSVLTFKAVEVIAFRYYPVAWMPRVIFLHCNDFIVHTRNDVVLQL